MTFKCTCGENVNHTSAKQCSANQAATRQYMSQLNGFGGRSLVETYGYSKEAWQAMSVEEQQSAAIRAAGASDHKDPLAK